MLAPNSLNGLFKSSAPCISAIDIADLIVVITNYTVIIVRHMRLREVRCLAEGPMKLLYLHGYDSEKP
ncbi:hypothetical protein WBP06_20985 [Novosphingobium sp. BL-8H]|uniref:hypothetical protein n=1 Tax=Novosphingobium sp. BL-8H TaxID=3127640 RepID=UPI0037564A92